MKNILITGGTGTFGNAFTKRVLGDDLFQRVTVLSRDEAKQQKMRERFDDDRLRFLLGDVRDRERLERAFQDVDAVVHCAALKQVDRSGGAFDEFLKTNTFGSLNVIEAANRAGVQRCVALSTDKAVEATTPYGVSKAAMEFAFVGASAWGPCKFACVRYGNILGSRGSVLEIWQRQSEAGEPLTLTDGSMTRFWLPIEQAVDLVLTALDRMQGGEIFIPKGVGRSSVAELARLSFPGANLVETGRKRSYEKRHECLVAGEEVDRLRDCGDVYVLEPLHIRWHYSPVGWAVRDDFQYRSNIE